MKKFLHCVLLAAPIILAGCQSLTDMMDAVPKPGARILNADLRGLSVSGAALMFDIEVSNPYAAALPLVDLSYSLASEGNKVLEGRVAQKGSIPAQGKQIIQLPANVQFSSLLSLLQGIKPGAVIGYTAEFSLNVDAPVLGPLSLPLSHRGELPIPAIPRIELASFTLEKLALDETRATAQVKVTNTNQFVLDLAKLGLNFVLGEQPVARASLANALSVKPGETATLQIPLSFSPRDVGMGLINLLRANQIAYQLSGSIEANTRFGPITLPLSRIGNTAIKR